MTMSPHISFIASRLPARNPIRASLSQRQLAAHMGVSLGKANCCLRALVEKGLVKLGNFSKNPTKRKEAEFAAIPRKTKSSEAIWHPKRSVMTMSHNRTSCVNGDVAMRRLQPE